MLEWGGMDAADTGTGCDQPAKSPVKKWADGNKDVAVTINETEKPFQAFDEAHHAEDEQCYYTATPLPVLPTVTLGPPRSRWAAAEQHSPKQADKQFTSSEQLLTMPSWAQRLQNTLHTAASRPFTNPSYSGTAFLQAAVALSVSVALVPIGVALQLQSTAGFAGADNSIRPWAGVLYIAAAVPLLRLLAAPVAYGMFCLIEVLVIGWPVFSNIPKFGQIKQLHRFSWLLTAAALLVWHTVVFSRLLPAPSPAWTSAPSSLAVCAAQAGAQAQYACSHELVYSYSSKVLCCLLLSCVASCTSAVLGMCIFYCALAAHGLTTQDYATPLLAQEMYMSVLTQQDKTLTKQAAQLQQLLKHKHKPKQLYDAVLQLSPLHQQQQYSKDVQQYVSSDCSARQATSSSPKPATAAAAVTCSAISALACTAVLVLSIMLIGMTVATVQQHIALATAVAVPAAAAATAGHVVAVAAMIMKVESSCPSYAAAAGSCVAALIACAAALVAAVLGRDLLQNASGLLLIVTAGVSGFAVLMSAAAVLLLLLTEEHTDAWSQHRYSRTAQAALWSIVRHIMQQYAGIHSNAVSSNQALRHQVDSQWNQEGAAAWRQLTSTLFKHKAAATPSSVTHDDLALMFRQSVGDSATAAAAADEAFCMFDCGKDGNLSEADLTAFIVQRNKAHLGLAMTLCNKLDVVMSIEKIILAVMYAAVMVVCLAVLGPGSQQQLWLGTVIAVALLALAFMCLFGDAVRQSLLNALWLLGTNPFNIGDIITFNNSDWQVVHINLYSTTLQCTSTGIPHSFSNVQLRQHSPVNGIANKTRCIDYTAAVRVSVVGMPSAKLGAFVDSLQAAAADKAASEPSLYVAGSCKLALLGDRLVCGGAVDRCEAELLIEWKSACQACDAACIFQAKAGMLHVVREQYGMFLAPDDNAVATNADFSTSTSASPAISMWNNPVYS